MIFPVFVLIFLSVAIVPSRTFSWSGSSATHTSITENGAAIALREYLNATRLMTDCVKQMKTYVTALSEIIDGNRFTDRNDEMYWTAHFHFDSELFVEAVENLVERRRRAKQFMTENNISMARKEIGIALHAVQDFYSHTNWVEMGKKEPCPATLGKKDFGVPLADAKTITCTPCKDASGCDGNVITDKLTSGYFKDETDPKGKAITKKTGKCNHGGYDYGSYVTPIGGISKDTIHSPHGTLHNEAARLAELATAQFLTDFGREIGNKLYEKFLGIDQVNSSKEMLNCMASTKAPAPVSTVGMSSTIVSKVSPPTKSTSTARSTTAATSKRASTSSTMVSTRATSKVSTVASQKPSTAATTTSTHPTTSRTDRLTEYHPRALHPARVVRILRVPTSTATIQTEAKITTPRERSSHTTTVSQKRISPLARAMTSASNQVQAKTRTRHRC